jgi:transposase InsO family protein
MYSAKYPVEKMCRVMGVSRSSYYDWLKKRPLKNKIDRFQKEVIKEFSESKQTYGSPRICSALNERGIALSKSTVARIMKQTGLQARPRRRFVHTTDSKHNYKVFENLLSRNFESKRINEKWVSDITYIPTRKGWTYLTVIIDLADKMVVGWSLSDQMTAKSTTIASLKIALKRRKIRESLIFHSARGVQYCSIDFRRIISKSKHIQQSMSRKGNCWDNAPAESFFKTLKVEWTNKYVYKDIDEARKSIFDYIERWYNTKRKHSAIGYMSPLEKYYFLTQTAA